MPNAITALQPVQIELNVVYTTGVSTPDLLHFQAFSSKFVNLLLPFCQLTPVYLFTSGIDKTVSPREVLHILSLLWVASEVVACLNPGRTAFSETLRPARLTSEAILQLKSPPSCFFSIVMPLNLSPFRYAMLWVAVRKSIPKVHKDL